MAAISSSIPSLLGPLEQLKGFGSAIGTELRDLCQKTDVVFHRVDVCKLDNNGDIKHYEIKNEETKKKWDITVISYIVDSKTGDLYLDEDWYVITFKCFCILLINPIFSTLTALWELSRLAVLTKRTIERLSEQNDGEPRKELVDNLLKAVFDVVKIPVFSSGIELAAFYGIFHPYQGRRMGAAIESAWHGGIDYKVGELASECSADDLVENRPFYLARCFQKRGNLNQERVVLLDEFPLSFKSSIWEMPNVVQEESGS